ncbi:MAG: 1-acyl-sn-glycerol-3-phosphate acyltransferase [Sandaracinobacteroides sp.]
MTSAPPPAVSPAGTHIRYDLASAAIYPWRGVGPELYRWGSHLLFFLVRWKVAGDFPLHRKAVILAAPHTSNWDGVWMVATAGIYRVRLSWMGKASLGRGPLGWLARLSGLVPIDRSGGKDLVQSTVQAFEQSDQLQMAIAPEGTRASVGEWKSGFYHIARLANVPIVFAVMDWNTRTVRISGEIWPSGDYEADLVLMRSHYADARGRFAGRFSLGDGRKV